MSRCPSCDAILEDFELSKKTVIETDEGVYITIDEDFCNNCLSRYVYGVDVLDGSWRQLEDICDDLYPFLQHIEKESE